MNRPDAPAFGPRLKAMRLGYHYSERHGAFIRASDCDDRIYIELAPISGPPNRRAIPKYVKHRAWWDDAESRAVLDLLPWLRPVRRVLRYIAVECDDDGRIIRAFTGAGDAEGK